jgi:fusion and transport protein UGO1
MSSPASLRDLYNPPSSAWSFLPAPKNPVASSSTPTASADTPTYQWSTRPTRNSIFELSPALDLSEPAGINVALLARSLVAAAVLEYTSTAIAMPWEVAKLLLQVQWVPRDAGEPDPEPLELIEETEDADLSDSSNDDSYFADPHNATPARYPAPRMADEQGYVIRRSVLEEGTRPEYIIPVGSADGVWGMIKRVGRFRGEGWLALWKGLLTSCVLDMLSSNLQPLVQSTLQSLFFPTLSQFQQPPLLLPVASHLITGLFLSPLDLIRTRLIVQSFLPRHRTYSGPTDALGQILRTEGGLRGIYFHPHLFIPTLLDNTLRPLLSLAFPALLAARMHISEDANPAAWALAEFAGSCASLLITLPIETVRRRLQVQVRGTARPLKACVELRRAPYNGVVDAMWRILSEERSDLPVAPRRKRRPSKEGEEQPADPEAEEGWLRNTGLGQLYRGLSLRLGAGLIVFLLAVVSGGEERDSGWAEI